MNRTNHIALIELLEARQFLHALHLTPLVQVSPETSPFFGHPIEANDPPWSINAEVQPSLAVDPTNPNHLVGVWMQDLERGMVAAVSFNAGHTWETAPIPGLSVASGGTSPFVEAPWVSIGFNGDVYASALTVNADFSASEVVVTKSTDGGLTWGAPRTITTGSSHFPYHDIVLADPTDPNYVYMTWARITGGFDVNAKTEFARSTDGGQTWEPARTIYESHDINVNKGHRLVVLPDGTLLAFSTEAQWRGKKLDGGKILVMRSTDKGATWGPPSTIASIPRSLTMDFETGQVVRELNGYLGWLDAEVDPENGNLYVVFKDGSLSNGQFGSIAFSMSTDRGFNWSTPIKVNQTPTNIPTGNQQAFMPSIAVNDDGVVAVTYYDFRNNTPAAGLPTDYWMVHAHPSDGLTNPSSWSRENRMTNASFNMENAPPASDGFYLGWYQGLVAMGSSFGSLFAMPHGSDTSSVFFRDPLPEPLNEAASKPAPSMIAYGHAFARESSVGAASFKWLANESWLDEVLEDEIIIADRSGSIE
jgi:hypothetical protein